MKTIISKYTAKSNIHAKSIAKGLTLINSLSPNFKYLNKSGGIVQPQQHLIY